MKYLLSFYLGGLLAMSWTMSPTMLLWPYHIVRLWLFITFNIPL
jgi:hypothetical protein